MQKTRISFIGAGNMGRSLIGGLIANGYPAELLSAADPDASQRQQLASLFNVSVFESNEQALAGSEVVVLAVKPQAMRATLQGMLDGIKQAQPLVISIAAGIRLSAISAIIGENLPIIRVMPNTPSLIQAGAAALFANPQVNEPQRELAEAIMRSVGVTVWLDEEKKLDTVTALSGSGPAYYFLFMEAMEKAAVKLGLDEEQARLLTLETAFGAAKMALESSHDPAVLRQQVTSPGGTTESALSVLEQGKLPELVANAIAAANTRSIELADEFEDN